MGDSRPEIQYWDSCLFIDLLLNKRPERVTAILQALGEAKAGRANIVVSNLVLAEIRPRAEYQKDYEQIIGELLETNLSYMHWYGLPRSIAGLARTIGANFNDLLPADCIHLATAIEAEADVFFTFDGDSKPPRRYAGLLGYDRKISGPRPGSPALRITTPRVNLGPLFEAVPGADQKP